MSTVRPRHPRRQDCEDDEAERIGSYSCRRACLLPHLLAYVELIEQFAKRYGQSCWAVIYQVETRLRRECMERMRRRESKVLDAAITAGEHSPFTL